MRYKPRISQKLSKLLEKSKRSEVVKLILSDGREVSCIVDCLTYANVSDDDDTDIMVAKVKYENGDGELLAEEDIERVL